MKLRRPVQASFTVVALLLATACFGGDGAGASGGFRAVDVSGSVIVRLPGAEPRALQEGDGVPAGSMLRTGGEGFVHLEGDDDERVELQSDTEATITGARSLTLEIGRAFGQAPGEHPLAIASRGTAVRVAAGAAARVERLLGALRVAVYRGSAHVELLGRGVDVPALREVVIAGGFPLERDPRPLTLSTADRWDRRMLGEVLDFDRELAQYGTGFDSQFRGRVVAARFFTAFVALPSVSFLRPLVPTSEPSEVLVGIVFAQQIAVRAGGPAAIPGTFAQLVTLRDLGASWGLIAKEKGLDLRLVLQGVVDAIRRGTAPPPGPGTGGGGAGGGSGGGGGGGSGGGGSTPGPKPSPSPSPSPTETGSPEPPEECSLVEILLGNCSPDSATSPSEAQDCGLVGKLIDPDC